MNDELLSPTLLDLSLHSGYEPGSAQRIDPARILSCAYPEYPPRQIARAVHALARHRVATLWESAQTTDQELLAAVNLGVKGLGLVRAITFQELVRERQTANVPP